MTGNTWRGADGSATAGQTREMNRRVTVEQTTDNRTAMEKSTTGRISIRPMEESDLAEVAALEAETFSMPWSKKILAETLCREEMLFLVAREGGLLGYAGVCTTLDEGEVTNVAVAENARRRGVATRLLQELAARLAAAHIYRLVLEVRASNTPAIRLYESSGFVVAGTRKRFYERPVEDAYVMCREAARLEGEPAVPYGKEDASSLQ